MPEKCRLEPGDWHHLFLVEGRGISESPIRIDRLEWQPSECLHGSAEIRCSLKSLLVS